MAPGPSDFRLAVNCGSSSIKFQLYTGDSDRVVIAGSASNIQQSSSPAKLKFTYTPPGSSDGSNGDDKDEKKKKEKTIEKTLDSSTAYEDVFESILKEVTSEEVLGKEDGKENHERISIVCHRIVHGGESKKPIVIVHGKKGEKEILDTMDQISSFAPLHNHHAMLIVKSCLHSLPAASSVLCFDTLFHTTIPKFRTTYPVSKPPHSTPVPLIRYGFHGLSYQSILQQMLQHLGKSENQINLVVAHLGSGGSVCLIQGGQSMNTSMGLTPLEGLPGGTRSGSVDPSLIFHHTPDCSETVKWSGRDITKAEYVLNKESGFQALAGTSNFGEIISKAFDKDSSISDSIRQANRLTYDLYLDRLTSLVSSYISTLFGSNAPSNQLDGLVFSGGIGEKSERLRADVLNSLKWIEEFSGTGGGVDPELNSSGGKGKGGGGGDEGAAVRRITKAGSKVTGWIVETDEEKECVRLAVEAVSQ